MSTIKTALCKRGGGSGKGKRKSKRNLSKVRGKVGRKRNRSKPKQHRPKAKANKQEKNPNPLTCCCPQPFVHTRSGTRGQQARMSAQTNRTGTREDGRKGAKRQNEAIKQSEHKTKWKSSSLYTTTNHCTHHCTHHHTITQITPLTPVPMELMAAQSSWKGREEG